MRTVRNVGVVHTKENFAAIRAESLTNKLAEMDAKKALEVNAAGKKGATRRRPGTVHFQRGDFYENNVGRFVSVEANVDPSLVSYTCAPQRAGQRGLPRTSARRSWPTSTTPPATHRRRRAGAVHRPDVVGDYYQYHYQIFRIGNKGDGKPIPPR